VVDAWAVITGEGELAEVGVGLALLPGHFASWLLQVQRAAEEDKRTAYALIGVLSPHTVP